MSFGTNQQASVAAHVLFIVNNYPPSVGGVESHVFHLAKEIVGLGSRATVVALSDVPSDGYEGGVRVIRLRKYLPVAGVISFPGWGSARRVARRVSADGVTAVSTHTRFFPMSVVGARVARRIGAPVIHTEHGSDFVRSPSRVVSLASRLVDLTAGRWVLRNAHAVLGVSEQVVAFVGRLAGVNASVFYNAIDLEEWAVAAERDRTSTEPRFCFLGRLVPGKGWEDFLEAAAELHRRGRLESFAVEVMGDGPDRSKLEARVEALGLKRMTHIRGQVAPSVVKTLLTGSTLVNPTVLSEGFQTTLLESLAVGGQIVSYPVPGLDQLADDGAPVHKVEPGDISALASAMEQAALQRQKDVAPSVLAKWSWGERGSEYLGIISSTRHQ